MGGTDAVDQRVACYRPRVKTVTWMQRIFIHFLNVAVVNCFIYCKHSERTKLPQHHLAFREKLIEELCNDLWDSRQLKEVEHVDKRQKLANWEKDRSRLAGLHMPEMVYTEEGRELESIKKMREEGNSTARNYERGYCLLCTRRMSIKCATCGVYLCIINDEEGNNCFKEWHTQVKFRQATKPVRTTTVGEQT